MQYRGQLSWRQQSFRLLASNKKSKTAMTIPPSMQSCWFSINAIAQLRLHGAVSVALLLSCGLVQAQQGEPFLRCAALSDRTARVLCLEDDLEKATTQSAAKPAAPAATATTAAPARATAIGSTSTATAAGASSTPATPTAPTLAPEAEEKKRFALFGLLDREPKEDKPEFSESMQATVVDLTEFKPEVWTITLDNGQVWRQLYTQRYNLREGDKITIYRKEGALQFRLEAERFSGMIRVERVK
jgi:hypothetical protein